MLQILKILTLSLLCSVSLANASWFGGIFDFITPEAPPIVRAPVFRGTFPVPKERIPKTVIERWEELALIRLHIEDPTLSAINIQDPEIQAQFTSYRNMSRYYEAYGIVLMPNPDDIIYSAKRAFEVTPEQAITFEKILRAYCDALEPIHTKGD